MRRGEAAGKNEELTGPAPPQIARRSHWLLLGLLLVAGFFLRMHCLTCKPFWFDECFSVEAARLNWSNLAHLLWWREANMSLYYVLLRMWLHFGESPFFIRSLSVVLATATVAAVYWLGELLYDRRVGLIAAALLAFNAYHVRYAQEARSYALFVLLATLASGFLITFVLDPKPRNKWSYVVTSTLAVYSHFYALLLVASHWLVLRRYGTPGIEGQSNANSRDALSRAWIAIGVAVLPLLIFVAKTGAGPIRWISRPGLRDLFEFCEHVAGGKNWVLLAIYGIAVSLGVSKIGDGPLVERQSWTAWRGRFLMAWLIFPIVLTVLLSFARPVFLGRYMIFCLPALLILVARGIAKIQKWWLLAPVLLGILALASQGVSYVYAHDFDNERDASGATTDFVLDHAQPGDAILFHIAETRVPYEFFRSVRAGENTASPEFKAQLGPEIVFPSHGDSLDYRDFTGKPAEDLVRREAQRHPRIWVMLMNNGPTGNPDATTVMLTRVLGSAYPKVQSWQFAKVELRVYGRE